VNAPVDPGCERKLHQYLLRLNHAINMAKFGVDSDGDVVLTVELPTENLVYSEFADGLNAISYYSDEHYLDVLNLARDPEYQPAPPGAVPVEPDAGRGEEDEPGGKGGGEGWGAN
jgi:hypothetical protein